MKKGRKGTFDFVKDQVPDFDKQENFLGCKMVLMLQKGFTN